MKKILLIIATSVVVVFAFVVGKYQFFNKALAHANYGMRAICNEKEISSLYIGSSMFRQGINVAEIDPSAYLLSYNGNQPIAEELCLNYMLENSANIKRLVIDMYPYSAANTPDVGDSRTLMDGDINFTFRVYDMMKESKDFSYLLKMLLNANNETFVTWPITYGMVNSLYYRGSSTSNLAGKTNDQLDTKVVKFEGRDNLQALQLAALDRIIEQCSDRGIEVVFVESPKYYRVHDDANYNRMMKDYSDFLVERNVNMILLEQTADKLLLHNKNINFVSYNFANNDPSNFIDLLHLSGKGRDEFSRIIGNIIEIQ